MFSQLNSDKVYTPEEVAQMLKLSKNTVYDLINRGELIAKKIGKVYRIPANSLSFMFTGLDYDLYQAEKEDIQNLDKVQKAIKNVRKNLG